MAFDAGMVAALANELNTKLAGARVDKIQQPEKEEIVLTLRADRDNVRLSLSCVANTPRINITDITKENPANAPMFCMLLRKHLTGGRVLSVTQYGFERLIEVCFECRDEMGFLCEKYLIIEIMGKYSNIIFCDGDKKILSSVKTVDFTTSSKRQILTGMKYEYPPTQNKYSPFDIDEDTFKKIYSSADAKIEIYRFIIDNFMGISMLVAKELSYRATGRIDAYLSECTSDDIYRILSDFVSLINNKDFAPVIIKDGETPLEFSFMPIIQYEGTFSVYKCDSFSQLIDEFFVKKEKAHHIKQMSSDLLRFLTNNENRITKKIAIHKSEMLDAEKNLKNKALGDVITANIYMLKRGDTKVKLFDYSEEVPVEREIILDSKLSPSQNAQRYYKKYNKAKKAIEMLETQLKSDENELVYIRSVLDALSRVENENDIEEIKNELRESGYGVKTKGKFSKNSHKSVPMKFCTTNGYTVLCGKNNIQNDMLTFKTASKLDFWFHVKNLAGSHVVMICDGEEPPKVDFTEAAVIAATHSKAEKGQNVAVDYTQIKNIKKIPSAKLGLVIYSTNWTAYVTPDEKLCEKLRVR